MGGVGLVLGFGLILVGGLLMVSGIQDRTLKEILKGVTSHHKKGEASESEASESEPAKTGGTVSPAKEAEEEAAGEAGPPLKAGLGGPAQPLTPINPNPFSTQLLLPKVVK